MIKLIFRQFEISISHITGECALNDEGNLSFKAIFANDLYLEQVNYK